MAINQGVLIFISGSNVSEGNSVSYTGSINGINILYNNGLDNVYVEYTNNDSEILADPLHKVKIGTNGEESINNLRLFFESNGYFSNSITITYSVEIDESGPGIRVLFNTDKIIFFVISSSFGNLTLNSFSNNVEPTLSPKYFFQYRNIVGDDYRCEIYQKNFYGTVSEISGRVVISKSSAKDHFEPIIGTGLSLSLEANELLSFQDLYSQKETDISVVLYRNNSPVFRGFLKPDGVFQSFTTNIWNISIECVDGLGFLSDLSFVDDNGLSFSGKMSALDIVYNCLKRTGLKLNINTYINVFYDGIIGETLETDVLSEMMISVDRFVKSDDNTIMSCQEVLKSILELFNATITQDNAQWFIYRKSDIYLDNNPFFKKYDMNNSFLGLTKWVGRMNLGSQSDNYYPHHCNANQKIEIKGAISAFRLGYKYGFISSILGNGKLNHEAGTKIYEGWNIRTWPETLNSGRIVIDPVSTSGINFESGTNTGSPAELKTAIESTENVPVYEGYSFEFKSRVISYGYPVAFTFIIAVGDYSLMSDGSWYFSTTGSVSIILINADQGVFPDSKADNVFERTFSIKTDPLPLGASGNIRITMDVPRNNVNNEPVYVEVKSIELLNTFAGNNIVGEFHTVSRTTPVSSIVKENSSLSNGDSPSNFYTGAIYMKNKTTLTEYWHRGKFPSDTFFEKKPILRISAEDELRISQLPMQIFSGDVFGYMNYIAVYSINNIKGIFMPLEWNFNTYTNILSLKNLELYSPELYDIKYLKTDDYGETVKPTIS